MAGLVAALWASLSDVKNPAPTVESAAALMECEGLDMGDGRMIKFDSPEVRRTVESVINYLVDCDQAILEFMLEHPGAHTLSELAEAANTAETPASVSLHKFKKAGLVVELSPVPVEVFKQPPLKPAHVLTVPRFQIDTAAWLKHVKTMKEEQDVVQSPQADRQGDHDESRPGDQETDLGGTV